MRFLKLTATSDAVPIITNRLNQALHANESVLWLVSGGSNIPLEVAIMAELADTRLANLTIMLMDERYGNNGHPDSNFQQLLSAGFDARGAKLISTLSPDNLSLNDTAQQFADTLQTQLNRAATVVGLFGMGTDGHTAGIKPGSPSIAATGLVSAYDWSDYRRITMTFEALTNIDIAFVCAFGSDKLPALQQLAADTATRADQPASLLYDISDTTVLNDQLGDSL